MKNRKGKLSSARGRRCVAFFLIHVVLLSAGAWRVPAQKDIASDPKNAERLLDGYITVMTMAYPPAGGALAGAKGMLTSLGFFAKPDLVAEALKQLGERLDAIEGRIDKLENEIVNTRNEGRENANLDNVRYLRTLREKLEDVVVKLGRKPADQFAKDDIAREAERVANNLREDSKLWEWSDRAIKDHTWEGEFVKAGTFMPRDFKPMPTLELYQAALGVWMAAIENASGGKKDVIAANYGNALQRHIEFLSVSPDWDELNSVPRTLPEKIKSRVTASYVALSRLPDTGSQICSIAEFIQDDMARQRDRVGQIDYIARSKYEMCSIPAALANLTAARKKNNEPVTPKYLASPREEAMDDAYGADSMALLVKKMDQLRRTGTLREQFIGTFDTNSKSDDFNILYTVSPDGTLTWHRHMIRYQGGDVNKPAEHTFNPPKDVGSGWANGVKNVVSMGLLGIYALREDGNLMWHWHTGFSDGRSTWLPSREIGKGLTGFTDFIAQDDGVFYGRVQGDPGIIWGATSNYDGKKGTPAARVGFRITSPNINFAAFRLLFAGGKGVLYGVGHDGKLYWMKHNMYRSAVPDPPVRTPGNPEFEVWQRQWTGPVEILKNMENVKQAFSPGGGHLYFVLDDGTLIWRLHKAWDSDTGKFTFARIPYGVVAKGWGDYKFVFARITTGDAGSGDKNVDIIVN